MVEDRTSPRVLYWYRTGRPRVFSSLGKTNNSVGLIAHLTSSLYKSRGRLCLYTVTHATRLHTCQLAPPHPAGNKPPVAWAAWARPAIHINNPGALPPPLTWVYIRTGSHGRPFSHPTHPLDYHTAGRSVSSPARPRSTTHNPHWYISSLNSSDCLP